MGKKNNEADFIVRPRRAKRKGKEPTRFVNFSRAAQLLELAYDTISKAAEDGELEIAFQVEGANGRLTPVVTARALDEYRRRAIARLRLFTSDYHIARADALEKKEIF